MISKKKQIKNLTVEVERLLLLSDQYARTIKGLKVQAERDLIAFRDVTRAEMELLAKRSEIQALCDEADRNGTRRVGTRRLRKYI